MKININNNVLDLFNNITFPSNVCPFVPNEYMKVPDNYIPYVIPIKPEVDE